MAAEVLQLTVGVVIGLPGFVRIAQVMLFYAGQHRELYFEDRGDFNWLAQTLMIAIMTSSIYFCVGCGALYSGLNIASCVTLFMFAGIFITLTPTQPITSTVRPQWVRSLEATRSPEELMTLRGVGRDQLQRHPRAFRKIISTQDGWESWLMTLTHEFPMSRLSWYILRAEEALNEGILTRAEQIGAQVIAVRPDISAGYDMRAQALMGKHQFSEALMDMNRCIELEPCNADFYYRRARLHLMLDQMEAALGDLNTASDLRPDDERLAVLQARAESQLQQLREK